MRKLHSARSWVTVWAGVAICVIFFFGAYVFLYSNYQQAWSGPGGSVIWVLLFFAFVCVGLPSTLGTAHVQLALVEPAQNNSWENRAAEFAHIREVLGYLVLVCASGIGNATLSVGAWQHVTKTLRMKS
jgi:hypothetical protein